MFPGSLKETWIIDFFFLNFRADNEKLKSSMRKKDEEVLSLKSALDRFTTAVSLGNEATWIVFFLPDLQFC